jgi:predicted nuclease with TOPRIM domain
MTFDNFVSWVFFALLSGAGALIAKVLIDLRNDFKESTEKLQETLQELNKNVAGLLEKTDWHERELGRIDSRLTRLEERE